MPHPLLDVPPLALLQLLRVQADTQRLEELREVEAIDQVDAIVAKYGEAKVIRWVKSVAAMQSGTGGT